MVIATLIASALTRVAGVTWLTAYAAMSVPRVCVFATSVILLLAGISKTLQPRPFVSALRQYKLVHPVVLPSLAFGVPLSELALGVGVLLYSKSYLVASLAALLFLTFAGAMAVNLMRGRTGTPCGCGLSANETVSWSLVFRNVAFASIAFGGTRAGFEIAGVGVLLSLAGWALSAKLAPHPAPTPQGNLKEG